MTLIAAFGLNAGLNLVLGLAIAALLGPAAFGLFGLGAAGAVALNTLLFEGLRLSATRFYSDRTRAAEPWIRQALDRAYAVPATALVAASLAAALGAQGWGTTVAGAAVAGLGTGVFDYHAALARARFEGGLYLRLVAIKNALAFVLMGGAAWLRPEPAPVLAAAGLSQLLAAWLMRGALRDPPAPVDPARLRETWTRFGRYGLPLVAAGAIYQVLPVLNRGALAGSAGYAEAGYFALAADVTARGLTTLGMALDLLLFQIAVRVEATSGRAAAEAQVARNAALVAALLLPAAAGFWSVLPALEALMVPPAYRGPFALQAALMLPGLLCLALTSFGLSPVFQIRHRTGAVIAAAAIGLATDALGLFLLPPVLGPPGIALAQSLGLGCAMVALGARALTGGDRLRLPWRDLAAAAAASAAMLVLLWPLRALTPWPALALSVPLGAAFYGALVWRFDIAGLRALAMAYRAARVGGRPATVRQRRRL